MTTPRMPGREDATTSAVLQSSKEQSAPGAQRGIGTPSASIVPPLTEVALQFASTETDWLEVIIQSMGNGSSHRPKPPQ